MQQSKVKINTFFPIMVGLIATIILLILPDIGEAKKDVTVPTEVGGFVLGTSIAEYSNIEHSNYLKEVVVNDWHGFRKGVISYGVCDAPGEIIKLRMKYEDSSKDLFNKLFKNFKKKFGQPDIWKGDSFGVLHVWKWKFIDKSGRPVSLSLQHNLYDQNETIGNEVKLSLPVQEEKERLCFIESCEIVKDEKEKREKENLKRMDWDFLIPR